MIRAILFFACLGISCAHTPAPAPSADAGYTYQEVCDHLSKIGCIDGQAANCASVLQQMMVDIMTTISLTCLSGAGSLNAARDCGGVACSP